MPNGNESYSGARHAIKQQLEIELPDVLWVNGNLASYFLPTQMTGGVSNVQIDQHLSQNYAKQIIKVQVFDKCLPDPENLTISQLPDPEKLEDIAQRIDTAMRAIRTDPNGRYWDIMPTVVNWPLDPNEGQTRIEMQWQVMTGSWQS